MAQRVPSATATLSDDCWVTWLSVAPVLRWEIYGNLTHGLFWHQKDEDLVELWVLGASSQEKTETIPSSKPCLHMFTPTHPEALLSAICELVISCYIFVYRFVYLVYLVYCLWYPTSSASKAILCREGVCQSLAFPSLQLDKFADVKPHRLQVDVYQIPRFERNQRS